MSVLYKKPAYSIYSIKTVGIKGANMINRTVYIGVMSVNCIKTIPIRMVSYTNYPKKEC